MKALQVIPVSKVFKAYKVASAKTVSKVFKDQEFKVMTVLKVWPVKVTRVFKVLMLKVFKARKVHKVLYFKVYRVQKERLVSKVYRVTKA